MPETREITVYKFDELSDKAKAAALEEHAEHGMEYQWWDSVYECATEDGKEKGFEIDDIRFSGFWSQGDGASWTGRVRVGKYLDWKLSDMQPDDARYGPWVILRELVEHQYLIRTIEISRGGGMYVHEETMCCDVDSRDCSNCDPDNYANHFHLNGGVLAGARVSDLLRAYDFNEVIDTVIKQAYDDAKDYARDIYKLLEKEHEWLTSEEYFGEIADANEWRFNDEGSLVS